MLFVFLFVHGITNSRGESRHQSCESIVCSLKERGIYRYYSYGIIGRVSDLVRSSFLYETVSEAPTNASHRYLFVSL